MTLHVPPGVVDEIRRHGQKGYPDEVCGFLIGHEDPQTRDRRVARCRPVANAFDGSRRARFLIQPRDLMDVEDALDGTDEVVLGFYHTHPDHPARPSEFDRSHAWPWFSYVVLAVHGGKAVQMTSWRLRDDRSRFDEEAMETL